MSGGLLQIQEPQQTTEKNKSVPVAVGIDLGTTHSLVGQYDGKTLNIFSDEQGRSLIPSIVSYNDKGQAVAVGKNSGLYIRSAKRFLSPQMQKQNKDITVGVHKKQPVEVLAEILRSLKAMAEKHLGKTVTHAVITVPAYFDDNARAAVRNAAHVAQLEVLRLLNEPTAAAIAYGLDHQSQGLYGIYDLGGGTFDFSILKFDKGIFRVLATAGHPYLGGDDFDSGLQALIVERTGKSCTLDHQQLQNLKHQLSHQESVSVKQYDQDIVITKTEFEKIIEDSIRHTLLICDRALRDAHLSKADLNAIVFVGGSTRIPLIETMVHQHTQRPVLKNIHPDEAVLRGAALQAHALTVGAEHLLLDVTPLSLGLEVIGGMVEKIIPRNSPIPIQAIQEFTTYQDGQTAISFHVVQGEREMAEDCLSLAKFILEVTPKKAGQVRVKVNFSLDEDGILSVRASETETEKEYTLQIQPSYGLSTEKLKELIHQSQNHAAFDLEKRLFAQVRVQAENDILSVEKVLHNQTATDIDVQKIEKAILNVKKEMNSQNREQLQNAMKNLERLALPMMKKILKGALQETLPRHY